MGIRAFIAAGVSALAMAGSISIVQAAAQKPYLMSDLVGTWNCMYDGPKGHQTSTITFSAIDGVDNWIQDTEKDGKYGNRPAHSGAGMMGYDSKKGQYVSMGGSTLPGDYGMGHAKASPSATSMTFSGDFPVDPSHDKTSYTFGATKVTYNETWTEKGKAMTAKGSCTKAQ